MANDARWTADSHEIMVAMVGNTIRVGLRNKVSGVLSYRTARGVVKSASQGLYTPVADPSALPEGVRAKIATEAKALLTA